MVSLNGPYKFSFLKAVFQIMKLEARYKILHLMRLFFNKFKKNLDAFIWWELFPKHLS